MPKTAADLTIKEATDVIENIQAILWLDVNPRGDDVWNPDKEWDSAADFLDMIADVLINAGMNPGEDEIEREGRAMAQGGLF